MIYDYRSDETIQEVLVECPCPIISDLIDEYSTLRRYESLSIYAPSWLAREIISRLLDEIEDLWMHEDAEIGSLSDDDNEVIITIGYDGMMFIETARRENGLLKGNDDCALTYLYDEFSKKDLDVLSASGEAILIFGIEEDEIEDENTELDIKSDGDMHGFSVNQSDENGYSSYSFYSTDLSLVNEMAKLFR